MNAGVTDCVHTGGNFVAGEPICQENNAGGFACAAMAEGRSGAAVGGLARIGTRSLRLPIGRPSTDTGRHTKRPPPASTAQPGRHTSRHPPKLFEPVRPGLPTAPPSQIVADW
eukprot:366028-Chlamydomonas_euryale.AAC.3